MTTGMEPTGFRVGFTWWAPGAALGVGLVVGALGVGLSARRASRVAPLSALRAAAAEPRPMTLSRWLVGLGTLALGGGLALLLPGATAEQKPTIVLGSAMVLLVAAVLLAPVFVGPVVRLITWPVRRGPTALLVREGAKVSARRVASTAAPVLAAVGFAVLLVGTFQTADKAAGLEGTAKIPESAVAARAEGAPGLSDAAVRAQPGRSELVSTVYLDSGRPVVAAGAAVDGLVAAGNLGWAAGQSVPLRFADGSVLAVTVAAVSAELPEDSVSLPRDLVRAHDPVALAEVVFLSGDFVPAPGAERMTARQYVERLMATNARRPAFITLHRAGATTAQTVRVVVSEALLAVLVGSLLGLAVAVPALFESRAALQDEIGTAVTLVMPWGTLAAVVSVCGVLAAVAAALPLLRARSRPGDGGPVARTMAG